MIQEHSILLEPLQFLPGMSLTAINAGFRSFSLSVPRLLLLQRLDPAIPRISMLLRRIAVPPRFRQRVISGVWRLPTLKKIVGWNNRENDGNCHTEKLLAFPYLRDRTVRASSNEAT